MAFNISIDFKIDCLLGKMGNSYRNEKWTCCIMSWTLIEQKNLTNTLWLIWAFGCYVAKHEGAYKISRRVHLGPLHSFCIDNWHFKAGLWITGATLKCYFKCPLWTLTWPPPCWQSAVCWNCSQAFWVYQKPALGRLSVLVKTGRAIAGTGKILAALQWFG